MLRVKAATAINGDFPLFAHKFIAIRPLDATGVLLLLKMKYLISNKQLVKLIRGIMDNYKRCDVSDQALEIIIQQRLSELKVKMRAPIKLKRCPFCGGSASIVKREKDNGVESVATYYIICDDCDTSFKAHSVHDAAKCWNTRQCTDGTDTFTYVDGVWVRKVVNK